ncbi:MAG: ABC transporter permease [Actinomycetota bacterium]
MRGPRSALTVAGAVIIALLLVMAVLAPLASPHDPKALSGDSLESPSARHLLGTNNLGQDVLSQLIWGARSSLTVSIGAAFLAVLLGVVVGAGSGLVGGKVDATVMRLLDVILAIPIFPLLLVVSALFGSSRLVLILVIGMLMWPGFARIVRSQTLTLRQKGFVGSARGYGGGVAYLVRHHLAPALGPLLVTQFVTVAGIAVFLEAGLGFLGLGDPIGVSWGRMMNTALAQQGIYFTPAWTWLVLPTGFAITLAVMGFTFLGIGLETRFNPRAMRTV